MNRDEARIVLQAYRAEADSADRLRDPILAEALKLLDNDPELARWFEQEQAFDARISAALKQAAPPGELRQRILARAHRRWWNRSLHPAELALAASVVLVAALAGMWLQGRGEEFARLRDRVIEQSWNGRRHVDLETPNLAEIRRFIAAHHLRSDFHLPPELSAMQVRGCTLLEIERHKVPFICFGDGARHVHLAIIDEKLFPGSEVTSSPDFAQWNKWSTATWSNDGTTFVLAGMRPVEFVKRFRKERQWTWGG